MIGSHNPAHLWDDSVRVSVHECPRLQRSMHVHRFNISFTSSHFMLTSRWQYAVLYCLAICQTTTSDQSEVSNVCVSHTALMTSPVSAWRQAIVKHTVMLVQQL